jgi:glycosyltransferase involved in cell wall biosynthesis
MVKILFLITDLGVGGAEKLLWLALRQLDRNRYSPVVCCLYGGELLKEIEALGVRVINLKVKNKLDLRLFWKLYFVLRRERPEILHTHLFHANISGRIMAKFTGIPVVISTQHHSTAFHGRLGIWADRLTACLTDKIIAVSEAAKRFCIEQESIPAKKISVVYNGIELVTPGTKTDSGDLRKQLSLGDGPLIGSVGRFVRVKGYEYLLYAVPEIVNRYPDAKFIILGYGPLKHDLIKLRDALRVSDKVVFMEPGFEVSRFLSILDIYVLPSLSEGLSITLLEAMACEKPIIATDAGGNSELIIDGLTGLLVPPCDPGAMAKAIFSLLADRDNAIRLGLNARKKIEDEFNINKMLEKTGLIYDSLLTARAG